ncbi:MAG TPA: hypothetical protein DCE48_07555 [Lachnospiraceae bacterium]|uniref:hypothetical protein n=1 Tax=Anaerosporobacter sp. TaxID=1872529 RepID=UPI000ED5D247|nr:hypothetical protein [Anaerosporobacter sp.]HAB60545.1 hypothetical protein [Lachnospiraceae bacterium]
MADTEKVNDIDSVTVTAGVLGGILGVSERRVRGLAQEGIFVKASQGRYKLKESMHNYVLNLRVANDAGKTVQSDLEDELDLNTEKAKHERIKRHMSELKLALMKGEVHKSNDVEAVMMDMLVRFKTKIVSLPSKLTPQLVDRDKSYILNALTEELNQVLEELSSYNAADFYGKEYIDAEELDEEQEEDDEIAVIDDE